MNVQQRHIQMITGRLNIAVDRQYENASQHVYHCPLANIDLKKGAAEGRFAISRELPGATVIVIEDVRFAVAPAFDMITVEKASFS